MIEIEEAIGQVESLYRAVTGKDIPHAETPYASIPAEKDPVSHVQEQMDRLLFALGETAPMGHTAARTWMPTLALWESDDELLLAVDLPGVQRDHLDVSVQAGVLVITGSRPPQVATNQHRLRVVERPLGPFRRVVPLPPGLRTAEMTAQIRDGVLEVRIPRDSAHAPRAVPVA